MFSACRCASGNFSVPAEQTCLLYKEVPELPRLAGTTRNLPAAESGVFS
jgi:hypothetical protein